MRNKVVGHCRPAVGHLQEGMPVGRPRPHSHPGLGTLWPTAFVEEVADKTVEEAAARADLGGVYPTGAPGAPRLRPAEALRSA
jgi:hypothetical protein